MAHGKIIFMQVCEKINRKILSDACILIVFIVSDVYLKNADFNANYDHAVGETGNVAQQICELPGWNKDFSVNYMIAGVYQIGTNKTFNGAKVPDKAFDGTTSGGVLALSTGWEQALKYYQTVTLPAGNYTMKSAFLMVVISHLASHLWPGYLMEARLLSRR